MYEANKVSFLTSASIIATHRCNAACCACGYAHSKDTSIIDPKVVYRLLPEFQRNGIRRVTWTGGEPTLHPFISDLVEACSRAGIANTLITNGSTFDQMFHKLAGYIQEVILSLDAGNADDFKKIRGLDCFDELVRIPDLIKRNYPWVNVTICLLLQKKNLDRLEDFISLASALPINRVAFLVPDLCGFQNPSERGCSFGRQEKDRKPYLESVLPTQDQLDRFSEMIPHLISRLDSIPGLSSPTTAYLKRYHDYFASFLQKKAPLENPLCAMPHTHIVVTTEGTLKPCFFVPECFPIEGMKNPLHSEGLEKLRQKLFGDFLTRERSCRWCMQVARGYGKVESC